MTTRLSIQALITTAVLVATTCVHGFGGPLDFAGPSSFITPPFHGVPDFGVPVEAYVPDGHELPGIVNGGPGELPERMGPIRDPAFGVINGGPGELPDLAEPIARGVPGGSEPGIPSAPDSGVPTSKAQFPYTVSLRRRDRGVHFCGGALIGPRHVLTAAHCVSIDARPTIVIGATLASQTTGDGVEVFSTKSEAVHPAYFSRRRPDLAILELDGTSLTPPVGLPASENDGLSNDKELTLIGWGRTSSSSGNSDVVQIGKTKFVPNDSCRKTLGRWIFRNEMCSGGEGTGACPGDGGGPIIIPGSTRNDDVLVGILGSLHSCGGSAPDVDTRVSRSLEWIDASTR